MADQTAASARDAINNAYASYLAELKLAAPHWERKPEGAAAGEAAWCARQVVEHIAGAAVFFGAGIAGQINVQGPQMQQAQIPDAADAVSVTETNQAAFMSVANQVTDAQMGHEFEHPRLGKQTVAGILGLVAHHLGDHANQLKTLRGG